MIAAARAACGLLLLAAAAADASPFPTRDQNPLIADYGLPMPMPAQLPQARSWSLGSSFNWSSSAIAQGSNDEALIVDAETRELRLTVTRALGERLAVQLQMPYRYIGPGVLDGFIDEWHGWFGLSEGARAQLPEDQLLMIYERDGSRLIDERSSSAGFGNLSADVGIQLVSTQRTHAALWLSVKLPTSALDAPGHDTADASVSISAQQRLASRWSIYGQASVAILGEDDVLGDFQERTAWSGHAGVSVRAWRNLDFKLQVDAHSAIVDDSELDYLGNALALTFGGSYEFDAGWRLETGITEDISIDASPDVVFVLGVQRTLGPR